MPIMRESCVTVYVCPQWRRKMEYFPCGPPYIAMMCVYGFVYVRCVLGRMCCQFLVGWVVRILG